MPEAKTKPEEPWGTTDALTLPEEKQIEALNEFLVKCHELEQVTALEREFNVLKIFGFEKGEIRHSNVLAWLLSPYESHGIGDRFLRRWLMRVIYDSDRSMALAASIVRFAAQPFKRVLVHREWHHIDLLIEIEFQDSERWVIAIENKVKHTQGPKQLKSYRELVNDHFQQTAKTLFVFLTVEGRNPEDVEGNWIIAFHSQIKDVLEDLSLEGDPTIKDGPKHLIRDYINVLERDIMNNPNAEKLAQEIYAHYRVALDIIFEYKPDETAKLTEAVSKALTQRTKDIDVRMATGSKGVVRFMPRRWATPENLNGDGWGKESAYVLCEISLTGKQTKLQIVQNKAPKEWREDLWKSALDKPLKRIKKGSGECGVWFAIFSHNEKAPSRNYKDTKQTDSSFATDLVTWVEKVLQSPDFKSASELVEEKLKQLNNFVVATSQIPPTQGTGSATTL
jgi:hypothetical protein